MERIHRPNWNCMLASSGCPGCNKGVRHGVSADLRLRNCRDARICRECQHPWTTGLRELQWTKGPKGRMTSLATETFPHKHTSTHRAHKMKARMQPGAHVIYHNRACSFHFLTFAQCTTHNYMRTVAFAFAVITDLRRWLRQFAPCAFTTSSCSTGGGLANLSRLMHRWWRCKSPALVFGGRACGSGCG